MHPELLGQINSCKFIGSAFIKEEINSFMEFSDAMPEA